MLWTGEILVSLVADVRHVHHSDVLSTTKESDYADNPREYALQLLKLFLEQLSSCPFDGWSGYPRLLIRSRAGPTNDTLFIANSEAGKLE